jgi:hypothetical protein
MKTTKLKLLPSIIQEKCPNCNKGHVFQKRKHFFAMPVMNEHCECCNYYFEREPGYFLGAMYVSYGLAVFQGIAAFLIAHFLFDLNTFVQALAVVGTITLMGLKNYKWSRLIYLHIFPQ